MIKTFALILLSGFLSTGQLTAQNVKDSIPSVESHLWKINIIVPGLEYERQLGRFSTININPHVGLGYSYNIALGDAWLVQPSLDVQLRRYYNLLRRSAKGRRTSGNSGSYFALSVLGVARSVVDREYFRNQSFYGLGPLWGIQRTYRSGFNIAFQAGGIYIRSEQGEQDISLRLNLRIGLALKKR